MKWSDRVKQAVERWDAREAVRIVDALRSGAMRYRGQAVIFRHRDILDFVSRHAGVDPNTWEALVTEGDRGEDER